MNCFGHEGIQWSTHGVAQFETLNGSCFRLLWFVRSKKDNDNLPILRQTQAKEWAARRLISSEGLTILRLANAGRHGAPLHPSGSICQECFRTVPDVPHTLPPV